MNGILCNLTQLLNILVNVYTFVLIAYAIVSWFPGARGRWVDYLAAVVEPVLRPVRRVIPPIGGLDIAFLVVILVLQFVVRRLVESAVINSCFRIF